MDNTRFHKTERVRDAIADANYIQKLLPPYSPHLNAAESVFSSVKIHVRKEVVEVETLSGSVANALARITGAMATRWIREVG
jgi:transposase